MRSPLSSHLVYRTVIATGIPSILRRLQRSATVFCFHNVVPTEDVGRGDTSLHMGVSHFATLVEWISESYRVVELEELAERVVQGRPLGGLAALTFDDAYVGTLRHGLPVLERLGLPATIFVVSEAATSPELFWWDVLGENGRLSGPERTEYLERDKGLGELIDLTSSGVEGAIRPNLPADWMPEDWSGIQAAVEASELFTVGSHTSRHPNLTRLSDEELSRELVGAREEIGEALGTPPDVVSYPYGRYDTRVLHAAREAGYRIGMTLGGASLRPRADLIGLPRLNVPASIDAAALACWAVGLHPARA